MSIWDLIKEVAFDSNIVKGGPNRKIKIPGDPLDNIIDAIDPLKIAKRKI